MRTRKSRLVTLVVTTLMLLASMLVVTPGSPVARAQETTTVSDFNGDGYDDLLVTAPREDLGNIPRAGAVTVLYGSAVGPSTTTTQLLFQGLESVPGIDEPNDHWGTATATGDIDNDGYDDLVVGSEENVGTTTKSGAITVLFGSPNGLGEQDAQLLFQASPGVPGLEEPFDRWGSSLAMGDLNGDGNADIVVGAPGEAIGPLTAAGAITVLYGSSSRTLTIGAQSIHQDTAGVPGVSEAGDNWGASLIVADMNGDGFGDLGVGAPNEDIGATQDSGAVTVLYGSDTGLSATGSALLYQSFNGVPGAAEAGDRWGSVLTAGDTNGDTFADLVVGAPNEDIGDTVDAGAVTVLFGSALGVQSTGGRLHHQSEPAIPGGGEPADAWGSTLALGLIDGDGFADIVVGAPQEGVGPALQAGALTVLYGSAAGPSTARATMLHQDTPGVPGVSEAHDHWAATLRIANYDGAGGDDIAVGAPGEGVGAFPSVGATTVVPSTSGGLAPAEALFFSPGYEDVPGASEAHDEWGGGAELAPGDRMVAVEAEVVRLVNELRTNPAGSEARDKAMPDCVWDPFYDLDLTTGTGHPAPTPPVSWDNRVATYMALDWSQQRSNNFGLVHRPGLGDTTPDSQLEILNQLDISPSAWGENVAWWTGDGAASPLVIARLFFELWRESDSSHYCNMLSNRFTYIGVGALWSPQSGRYWITQNFYRPL